MTLPKWTEKTQFTDRDWTIQMERYHKAIAVAIEALEKIKEDKEFSHSVTGVKVRDVWYKVYSGSALAQIEKMGSNDE